MNAHRLVVTAAVALLPAFPAGAEELSPSIWSAAACAPVGTVANSRAPQVVETPSQTRTIYNAGEEVTISGGTNLGLQAGQRYIVRRPMTFRGAPRAEHTIGWVRIVSVTSGAATAQIEFTCDAVATGDHLEAYVEPAFPAGIDRTDASGTPDFTRSARVLYGNEGREVNGGRDFVLAAMGQEDGVTPGARYAVYRGRVRGNAPAAPFAETVVVSVFADQSVLRVTDAQEAVTLGDTVVLRVGGGGATHDPGSGAAGTDSDARPESELVAGPPEESRAPERQITFEDVHFDLNRHTLKPPALALLDDALKALQEDPTLRIQIEGHTCNIGAAKYNLALGKRRAGVVRDYLVSRGIAESRLTTVSYGESQPKYDNRRRETRPLNRRAALVVNIQREADSPE